MTKTENLIHDMYKEREDLNDIFDCIASAIKNNTKSHSEDFKDLNKALEAFKSKLQALEKETI